MIEVGTLTPVQSPIVDEAAASERTGQVMRLGRSGIEAIPVRFLGHAVPLAFLLFDVLANGFNGHAPSGPANVLA